MLTTLYELWQWIVGAGSVIAVVALLIAIPKQIKIQAPWQIILRLVMIMFVIVASVVVCLSCIVGTLFAKVPEVYGGTVGEATTMLHNAGLEIVLEPGMNRDENWTSQVIGQSPEVGSLVLKESQVLVYINTQQESVEGKETACVPNLVGLEQHEAITLLSQNGLQFQVWWTEENNVVAEQYYVISQSIPEGSEVPIGTLIGLELAPIKQ